MQKNLLVLLLLLVPFFILGQDLEKKWKFSSIEDSKGNPIAKINKETDYLNITESSFSYFIESKNNLNAKGDLIFQNNLLVFYYTLPKDTIRRYKITEHTDSTLVFKEKKVYYKFYSNNDNTEGVLLTTAKNKK
jgi:CNT family concentrative nucleoside transporter